MNWKRESLENFRLYAVTDLKEPDSAILQKIDDALLGGVDMIQLRSKLLSDKELYDLSIQIQKMTSKRKKLFIINDRIDLAIAADADGIHLGQDDLPIQAARKIAGKEKIIGISTHSVEQAVEAEKNGADYIGFGPIFGTPTKPDYKPIGLEQIREVNQKLKIPFVCIGGIDLSNVNQVVSAGAKRIAVVRAIFNESDPKTAAQKLKQRMV